MQNRSTANVMVFVTWSIQHLIVYQNEREGFSSTSNEGLLANTVHEHMLYIGASKKILKEAAFLKIC